MTCIDHQYKGNKFGYAYVKRDTGSVGLHRLVYCQHNNITLADLAGRVIRHTCDNTRCINPDHLLQGTSAENSADMVARGRSTSGETHPGAKLGQQDVALIRSLYVKGSRECGAPALARRFDIAQQTVWKIVNNRHWRTAP